jgi:hypothetical protein
MIARASDIVAMSFRAFATRNFIIVPLVFADNILLSVRIDRLIHPEKTASTNKTRSPYASRSSREKPSWQDCIFVEDDLSRPNLSYWLVTPFPVMDSNRANVCRPRASYPQYTLAAPNVAREPSDMNVPG